MKKILLTGGSGMVGRNILEHQDAVKYDIIAPASAELNLMDYEAVKVFIAQENPNLIIHAAGKVGGIQANMDDLYGYLVENLMMGINLVRAAKENKIKNFLNLSSSCVYPKDAKNPLQEECFFTGSLEPTNEGYAIAKNTVMRACEYISRDNEKYNYKTIVPCNLYGRYDKFDPKNSHMIPAVIRKIAEAKESEASEVEIWGTGEVRREFLYAGDLADAIYYSIDNFEKMPIVMNVSPGKDYSINEFYQKIAKVIEYKGGFTHNVGKPEGIKQKLTDNGKLKNFGWQPKLTLGEGIDLTYKFFINEWTGK